MKRLLLAALAALTVALATGCSSFSRLVGHQPPRNTVALSITVDGSGQPSPVQWAALVAMLEPTLAARGWVLVHDLNKASQILRINFIPDPSAPETNGQALIVGLIPNPRTQQPASIARGTPTYSTFSSRYSYRSSIFDDYYGDHSRFSQPFQAPPAVVITPPVNIPHCPPEFRDRRPGGGDNSHRDRGDYARSRGDNGWHRDTPSRDYTPSYSSSNDSYSPPPAPAPSPAPSVDFTPPPSSSAADHPTSG